MPAIPFDGSSRWDDEAWHCLSCGLVFQEDDPDVWRG